MYPTLTDGQKWTPVPYDCTPETTGGMLGVYLHPDENVEWHFSYGADGKRFITGYTITKDKHNGE